MYKLWISFAVVAASLTAGCLCPPKSEPRPPTKVAEVQMKRDMPGGGARHSGSQILVPDWRSTETRGIILMVDRKSLEESVDSLVAHLCSPEWSEPWVTGDDLQEEASEGEQVRVVLSWDPNYSQVALAEMLEHHTEKLFE